MPLVENFAAVKINEATSVSGSLILAPLGRGRGKMRDPWNEVVNEAERRQRWGVARKG